MVSQGFGLAPIWQNVTSDAITVQNTNALFSTGIVEPAGVGAVNATDAIFLGRNAGNNVLDARNAIIMGPNAGAGATYAYNSIFMGKNAGLGTLQAVNSIFMGEDAGSGAGDANYSVFMGVNAGTNATRAFSSNFLGAGAGYGAVDAQSSNFFGEVAGNEALNAYASNFIGVQAGNRATNARHSNFFGDSAGSQATNAIDSAFIGTYAGFQAANANDSTFMGERAGREAINANNSLFLGKRAGYLDTDNNSTGGTSILIGDNTNTGGFSNSIAMGKNAQNTAANQFLLGSGLSPINTLVINGFSSTQCTIVSGTGLSCSSDRRLKQGITALNNSTSIINALNPVTYQWNGGSETQYGLIAQEVQAILPDLVTTNSDGYLSLSQQELMPFVIKALQETNAKVDANSQGTNVTATSNTFTQPNIFNQTITAVQDLIIRGVSYLQNLVVQGSTIFQGRVEFQDRDMAGVATIRLNTKEIEVRYTKPYNFTPVVNITSLGQRITGNLKSSNANGFVIEVENPALTNLKFNWTAINVRGEELISTSSTTAVSSSSSATNSSSSSSFSSSSSSILPVAQSSSSVIEISNSSSVESISSNVSSSSSI